MPPLTDWLVFTKISLDVAIAQESMHMPPLIDWLIFTKISLDVAIAQEPMQEVYGFLSFEENALYSEDDLFSVMWHTNLHTVIISQDVSRN